MIFWHDCVGSVSQLRLVKSVDSHCVRTTSWFQRVLLNQDLKLCVVLFFYFVPMKLSFPVSRFEQLLVAAIFSLLNPYLYSNKWLWYELSLMLKTRWFLCGALTLFVRATLLSWRGVISVAPRGQRDGALISAARRTADQSLQPLCVYRLKEFTAALALLLSPLSLAGPSLRTLSVPLASLLSQRGNCLSYKGLSRFIWRRTQ